MLSAYLPDLAIWRPATNTIVADYGQTGTANRTRMAPSAFRSTDQLLVADINGDTVADLAAYRDGLWIMDYGGNGTVDRQVTFGSSTARPVLADVAGTGRAALGTYEPATGQWTFATGLQATADLTFTFRGSAGAVPLAADLNNNGKADVVLFENGVWRVKYDSTFSSGTGADLVLNYANGSFTPFLCDVNGDGQADLGAYAGGYWYISTNRAPAANMGFALGQAGDVPLPGYYDTSRSVFVAPAGSDSASGVYGRPVATLSKAMSLTSASRSIIRIAAGTYTRGMAITGRSGRTIVGASSWGTVIAPASDAVVIDGSSNIALYNLAVRSTTGRGIVSIGSTVELRNVSTAGSRLHGLVAAAKGTTGGSIDARASRFDGSQTGHGVWLMGNGIPFSLAASSASNNAGDGILADDNAAVTILGSTIRGNGADGILAHRSALSVSSTVFASNGQRGIAILGSSGTDLLYDVVATGNGASNLVAAPDGATPANLRVERTSFTNSVGGHGAWLQLGAAATFISSGFSGNGTSAPAVAAGTAGAGLLVTGNSSATVVGSTLNGNRADGLLANIGTVNVQSSTFTSNSGRGIALMGVTAALTNVISSDNRSHSFVASNSGAIGTSLSVDRSSFVKSQIGYGMWLTNGVTATVTNSLFNRNGTDPLNIPGYDAHSGGNGGHGVVVAGNSVASFTACNFKYNETVGISAIDSSRVTVTSSTITGNKRCGFLASHTADVTLRGSIITQTGTIRGINSGYNGIEFLTDGARSFHGRALIEGNTISDNTAWGIFVGSGTSITILNNTITGNPVGIGINGMAGAVSSAVIKGNRIRAAAGSATDEGITLIGSGASATIGGLASADRNTFENYARYLSIHADAYGGDPRVYYGNPVLAADSVLLSQNLFLNCGTPAIGHTG